LGKGRLVFAEGRLRTRNWEGQDGQKHYRTEVIASRVSFLDRKGTAPLGEGEKPEEAETGEVEPDDIPF
jgi:single-strand DNA-binding protein